MSEKVVATIVTACGHVGGRREIEVRMEEGDWAAMTPRERIAFLDEEAEGTAAYWFSWHWDAADEGDVTEGDAR